MEVDLSKEDMANLLHDEEGMRIISKEDSLGGLEDSDTVHWFA